MISSGCSMPIDNRPNVSIGYARLQLFFRCQLRMGCGRRVNCKRSRVSDVGDMIEHLRCINEFSTRVASPLEFKTQQAAVTSLEIDFGAAPSLPLHEARKDHSRNFRVLRQISRLQR
jgi:hypothetical protein